MSSIHLSYIYIYTYILFNCALYLYYPWSDKGEAINKLQLHQQYDILLKLSSFLFFHFSFPLTFFFFFFFFFYFSLDKSYIKLKRDSYQKRPSPTFFSPNPSSKERILAFPSNLHFRLQNDIRYTNVNKPSFFPLNRNRNRAEEMIHL